MRYVLTASPMNGQGHTVFVSRQSGGDFVVERLKWVRVTVTLCLNCCGLAGAEFIFERNQAFPCLYLIGLQIDENLIL